MVAGLGAIRIAAAAASLVVMTHDAVAQSVCAGLDRLVPLARSRFWSIRDDAHATRGLRGRVGAAPVTPSERRDAVRRLASTIGQCYGVRPAYSDDDVDETIAFVDLPGSVSIHVNGAGETLTISIGSTFSIPEPYPQAP